MADSYIPHAGEALRRCDRHDDYSGIIARRDAGYNLTPEEQDRLDRLDRGAHAKRGPKNRDVAHETVVCWRWLVERDGWSRSNAYSLLGEILGEQAATIRGRVTRAQGTKPGIADRSFDFHVHQGETPALLIERDRTGRCNRCGAVKCKCTDPPRPDFDATDGGGQVRALRSLWSR